MFIPQQICLLPILPSQIDPRANAGPAGVLLVPCPEKVVVDDRGNERPKLSLPMGGPLKQTNQYGHHCTRRCQVCQRNLHPEIDGVETPHTSYDR